VGTDDREQRARANLTDALLARKVRWLNLVLSIAIVFAGAVALGAMAITTPPRGNPEDVIPFVVSAAVGQLGSLIVVGYGIAVMRSLAQSEDGESSPQIAETWRRNIAKLRIPLVALCALAGTISVIIMGASLVTILGAVLGLAFTGQIAVLLTVALR